MQCFHFKMRAFLPLFSLGLWLFCFEDGGAQENETTFSVIALSKLPYEKLYYRSGRDALPLQINEARRSKPKPIKVSEIFEIYADSDDSDKKYKLVGKAKFPVATRKFLFFLRDSNSTDEADLPIDIFGIDDSESKFPKSSFRFANFMNTPLAISFGKEGFRLRPKEFTIKKLALSEDGEFTPFLVRNLNGDNLGGTRLFSHAANREMILIFPPKKGAKRLDIRFFSD